MRNRFWKETFVGAVVKTWDHMPGRQSIRGPGYSKKIYVVRFSGTSIAMRVGLWKQKLKAAVVNTWPHMPREQYSQGPEYQTGNVDAAAFQETQFPS